jgi:hypothetical protein
MPIALLSQHKSNGRKPLQDCLLLHFILLLLLLLLLRT